MDMGHLVTHPDHVIRSVALVGVGGYGEYYWCRMQAAGAAHDAEVVAVVDPFIERASCFEAVRRCGVPVFDDVASCCLETGADLTVVASPIHFHVDQSEAALRAGSSVLCEKPISGSLAEARRLVRAAKETGRFAAIGYQWSFSPVIQRLKRDIQAGRFGAPRRVKTLTLWPRPRSYYMRNDWAGRCRTDDGRPVFDSPVNNANAHYLHNMFFLLGGAADAAARPVSLAFETYRANPIENFDTAAMRCRTADGVEILFYSSHAVSELTGPVMEAVFEEAVVRLSDVAENRITADFADGRHEDYGNPCDEADNKLWQSLEALDGGPVRCPVTAAMAQTVCVDAMATSGRPVQPFPAELVVSAGEPDDPVLCMSGLETALHACFEAGRLPSEMGFPWAAPATVVESSGLPL